VYPPTAIGDRHRLEVMTVVRVDGQPLVRPGMVHGEWSWFGWRSPSGAAKRKAAETTVDFYGWSQTCKFSVLSSKVHESLNDEWVRQAARFAYEFTRLPAGEHRVDIDLCYRITSTEENFDSHPAQGLLYPEMDTVMSMPLAQGSFTLVVPVERLERRSILPHRPAGLALPVAELQRLEEVVIDTMKKARDWGGRARKTERPMHAVVTSDWYESDFDHIIAGRNNFNEVIIRKICIRNGFNYTVVLRRLAADGWSKEHVAVFRLAAYGPESASGNPLKTIPPMTGIGVAGSFIFEPELLKEFYETK
jgi:hypothetical protein